MDGQMHRRTDRRTFYTHVIRSARKSRPKNYFVCEIITKLMQRDLKFKEAIATMTCHVDKNVTAIVRKKTL